MKCPICGSEMVHTIGGCYHCEVCKRGGINDLVLRYPNLATEQKNSEVDKIPMKDKPGHTDEYMSPYDDMRLRAKAAMKAYNAFVDEYRKELLSLTITPEIPPAAIRNTDLEVFNTLAGDFFDELYAILDGPPCEGWNGGSDCRTCNMTECNCNRVHSNRFNIK